jgi:hypothetical protein
MSKQNQMPSPAREQPGPGRSTSEIAFNDVRQEVADSNERSHQEARKIRAAQEREQLQRRRGWDV